MALVRVSLPDALPPVTPEVAEFIADAQSRIDAFVNSHVAEPINSFVPSDFPLAYGALRYVVDKSLATGTRFCEWGSGAGVVTCLAAMSGFSACGIEFEAELVELSAQLARDHDVNVEFYHGNLVPTDGQQLAEQVEEFEWLAVGGADAYSQMDLDIDDFDVVFAYPWPGERRVIERLFDRFAADGALLMTYDGVEGVRLYRHRSARAAQ
jgi:precorrin-6B methylase 2